MIRIATWNVNSVRARLPILLDWLREAAPDVLLLQEIKCEADGFPFLEMESLGFRAAVAGQRTYNGVAVLSRHPLRVLRDRLPGDETDEQARYLEVETSGLRVASLYVPNGNPVGTDKFAYKLGWLERLKVHVAGLLEEEVPLVLGADWNVAPEDRDVHDPIVWANDALCRQESRAAYRRLLHLGLIDAFRVLHPEAGRHSWWDYRAGAFARDEGLRIDHLLLSPQAADRLETAGIDRRPRALEKASDHTPVWCVLRDESNSGL
ncbi:MAG: exodeoxyribonuclease III [Magnetospirillum sp. WYHS-4]